MDCLRDTNISPVAVSSIIVTGNVSNNVNQTWQDTKLHKPISEGVHVTILFLYLVLENN